MSRQIFERSHVSRLFKELSRKEHTSIIAINGPRQVGKTTIALQVRQKLIKSKIPCWYIPMDDFNSDESDWFRIRSDDGNLRVGGNFDDSFDTGTIMAAGASPDEQILVEIWKAARRESMKSERGLVLMIDEIQIIPRWSNIVKGLWDTDRREEYPLQIVILGSAPWQLMIGRNESLAGRFDSYRITHWSLPEMTQAFGLTIEQFMFFGGYPEPFRREPKGITLRRWRNYILNSIMPPVIERDIMGLKRINNPALMHQLIDFASRYSGQIISYNKLLSKLQDKGNATTLADYLKLLSDAGLIVALDQYSKSPYRSRNSSPKLNVLNTALMTATSGYSFHEAQADRSFWGRIVESAVGAHLQNTKDTATHIHYWRRDSGKYEVDFVISRGPHLLGVEVKSGNTQARRGLDEFKARSKNARIMEVGPSANAIPFNEFFSLTADEWIEEKCVRL
ncbi:MAG: ATP-binding protein [Bacteroidetes bacterium]|nr:ATP-binding protein [Bacteroidota bacterium]